MVPIVFFGLPLFLTIGLFSKQEKHCDQIWEFKFKLEANLTNFKCDKLVAFQFSTLSTRKSLQWTNSIANIGYFLTEWLYNYRVLRFKMKASFYNSRN